MNFNKLAAMCVLPLGFVGLALWAWAPELFCKASVFTQAEAAVRNGSCFEFWLNRYQTLISGLLALAAAALTVRYLKLQINEERLRHENAVQAKSRAARIALPDALSAISGYTNSCIEYLKVGSEHELPVLSEDAVSALKISVEFVEGNAAEIIVELLKFLQITRARLEYHRVRFGPENVERAYEIVFLRALNDSLYDFGRGDTQDVIDSINRSDVITAYNICFSMRTQSNLVCQEDQLLNMILRRHPS